MGWGRATLIQKIKHNLNGRQGRATHNFAQTLFSPQSELVQEALKDPYNFDFLTLTDTFNERELEVGLITHIEKFLLELGSGFAYVGRQHPLTVSGCEFYLDLLFISSETSLLYSYRTKKRRI